VTAPTVHGDATSPAVVEPDRKAWLMVKGFDVNTAKWITRGTWTRAGGDGGAVTLTVQETSETTVASLAWFTAPRDTVTRTYTFQLTVTAASGETATGLTTITVPPYQGA